MSFEYVIEASRTLNEFHFVCILGGIKKNNRETTVFGLTEESVLLPGRHGGSGNIIFGIDVFDRQFAALVAVHCPHICHLTYSTSTILLDFRVCSTHQSRHRAGR